MTIALSVLAFLGAATCLLLVPSVVYAIRGHRYRADILAMLVKENRPVRSLEIRERLALGSFAYQALHDLERAGHVTRTLGAPVAPGSDLRLVYYEIKRDPS